MCFSSIYDAEAFLVGHVPFSCTNNDKGRSAYQRLTDAFAKMFSSSFVAHGGTSRAESISCGVC